MNRLARIADEVAGDMPDTWTLHPTVATLDVALTTPRARRPKRCSAAAAGLDLTLADDVVVASGRVSVFRFGLRLAIPDGLAGLILLRSGVSREHGLVICSSGLIDPDYRGEISLPVSTVLRGPWWRLGRYRARIPAGERVAQLVLLPRHDVTVRVVDDLPSTVRGTGGFGSTGRG
jgi:dUTP pyrophosphatase